MRSLARAFPFAASMAALVVCLGCGPQTAAPPVGWPTVLPAFADMVQLPLTLEWSVNLPGPSSLSLSPDASAVAGSGPEGPWGYSAAGQALKLPPTATGSSVAALPMGRIGVGPGASDPPGQAVLVSSTGTVLWSAPAVGPVTMSGSEDGRRVVVLDAGAADGTLLAVGPGGASTLPAPGLSSLGGGAQGQFDLPDDLLLSDANGVQWIGAAGGASRWVVRTGTALAEQLAVNPAGTEVVAATVAGENTLFEFNVAGSSPALQWSAPLAAGGADELLASSDRAVVWDLGGPATLAAYRASDGAMLWQDSLAQGTLSAVALTANDIVVALVQGCSGSQGCLLFLSPSGAPEGVAPLPVGARAEVATSGASAAVALVPSTSGHQTLLWWSLGAWTAKGASSAVASTS